MDKEILNLALRRAVIVLILSFVFVFAFSELAYALTSSSPDRDPQEIVLTIPLGTAEKIAAGQAEPTIPEEMNFVVGDTLVVKNEDTTDHQLGPLFIPAGTSASLPLQKASSFEYNCSFQPSSFFGIQVRQQATFSFRFFAIAYATPATAIFLYVYSIVALPFKKKELSTPQE